ncbi:MAG: YbjN domain-containing protein [Neomegalonema sp.]|nr:YbjN domain-containing protein [Neomegalonema sp.]
MSAGLANGFADADLSPIDIVEDLAALKSWDVDRLDEDQIEMAVSGIWGDYSLALAWFDSEEILRMVCTFELSAPEERRGEMLRAVEAANDRLWIGGFNLWADQNVIAFRYGLVLNGGACATAEQVEAMLHGAVENCERYHPVFHMVAHQGASTETALGTALLEAAGQA